MENIFTTSTIIFFTVMLINVILQTLKSILTVKSTKIVAMTINTIAFGFYTVIIKQIANLPIEITVVVTMLANFIGVYISMVILDKTKKDKLWKINITTETKTQGTELQEILFVNDISYSAFEVINKSGVTLNIDIFSENQKESALIKRILDKYPVKYTVVEIMRKL